MGDRVLSLRKLNRATLACQMLLERETLSVPAAIERLVGLQRRELFDLPNQSPSDGDVPATVRFLPEYDNLLRSHSNRTRVIADEHRSKVYLPGLRVAATILLDGFVRGVWKIEKNKNAATLVIEPFDKLAERDRATLIEEGERLIRFVEAKAKSFEVQFAD